MELLPHHSLRSFSRLLGAVHIAAIVIEFIGNHSVVCRKIYFHITGSLVLTLTEFADHRSRVNELINCLESTNWFLGFCVKPLIFDDKSGTIYIKKIVYTRISNNYENNNFQSTEQTICVSHSL